MKQPAKKSSILTHNEHIVMGKLAKRKDLIITNADKCETMVMVIMDTGSYIKETN